MNNVGIMGDVMEYDILSLAELNILRNTGRVVILQERIERVANYISKDRKFDVGNDSEMNRARHAICINEIRNILKRYCGFEVIIRFENIGNTNRMIDKIAVISKI